VTIADKNSSMQTGLESIWVLGDQLFPRHPLLDPAKKSQRVVVMIEAVDRMREHHAHQHKVILVLSAMRHFAQALREQGWRVDYREADNFQTGLRDHLAEFQPQKLWMMESAEWELRQLQHQHASKFKIAVEIVKNSHFLVEQFPPEEKPGKKLILENFYRGMRKHFGVLLEENGAPSGGAWNFDHENRKPYNTKIKPLPPISFAPDAITQEVIAKVATACPDNIGATNNFHLAVTREQALTVLEDFIENRLPNFGAYEDAMAQDEPILFHSVLSPLMNIGLLEPLEIVQRAEAAYRAGRAPINSVEGFIRQIIGWREYVYWRYHKMMPEFHTLNHWNATRQLPDFFWTAKTNMNCLQQIIGRVIETGYSHHIERLMVLCNFALLAGINPKEVNDWFLSVYFDAYDWVVTPNVIGMGLCADGGIVGTKPYISSAAYINKMSNYCQSCAYNPKVRTGDDACPFNYLYWNFLLRFEPQLRANPRMGPNVLGLKHLDAEERLRVQKQAEEFLQTLSSAVKTL
jgi:deoxyribodipyrimidine photolyase-related protein